MFIIHAYNIKSHKSVQHNQIVYISFLIMSNIKLIENDLRKVANNLRTNSQL